MLNDVGLLRFENGRPSYEYKIYLNSPNNVITTLTPCIASQVKSSYGWRALIILHRYVVPVGFGSANRSPHDPTGLSSDGAPHPKVGKACVVDV